MRLVRRQDPCIVVNNPSLSHRLPARVDEGEANIALQFFQLCPAVGRVVPQDSHKLLRGARV